MGSALKYQCGFRYHFLEKNDIYIEREYENILGILLDCDDSSADNILKDIKKLIKKSQNNKLMKYITTVFGKEPKVIPISYRND